MKKAVALPSEPSDAVRAYVRLVRAGERLHAEVSRELALHGLSASQFSALKALRLSGRLVQKDIAKKLLKTCGNITFLVDKLEAMELVVRERDPSDRRVIFVKLTVKGEELFDTLYPGHAARIERVMSSLSDEQTNALLNLLETVLPDRSDTSLPVCASENLGSKGP